MHENVRNAAVAVIIPTKGRPDILADTLASIAAQTLKPTQIIVSATGVNDLPVDSQLLNHIEIVTGAAGLCVQRNTARSRLNSDTRFVVMLDDDVELAPDYIERVVGVFCSDPGIGLVGGNVLAEGVPRQEAARILALAAAKPREESQQRARSLYGCNMSVRAEILHEVDFDENLRLGGWLEDVDWSVRAGRRGAISAIRSAHLVHLKTSTGRTSGRRFGFAQIVNPFYLYKKGTISRFRDVAGKHWVKCLAANIAGWVRRDSSVDRCGRLHGNMRGFLDLLSGKCDPRRIERL